jgi:hypothetical protein
MLFCTTCTKKLWKVLRNAEILNRSDELGEWGKNYDDDPARDRTHLRLFCEMAEVKMNIRKRQPSSQAF